MCGHKHAHSQAHAHSFMKYMLIMHCLSVAVYKYILYRPWSTLSLWRPSPMYRLVREPPTRSWRACVSATLTWCSRPCWWVCVCVCVCVCACALKCICMYVCVSWQVHTCTVCETSNWCSRACWWVCLCVFVWVLVCLTVDYTLATLRQITVNAVQCQFDRYLRSSSKWPSCGMTFTGTLNVLDKFLSNSLYFFFFYLMCCISEELLGCNAIWS